MRSTVQSPYLTTKQCAVALLAAFHDALDNLLANENSCVK